MDHLQPPKEPVRPHPLDPEIPSLCSEKFSLLVGVFSTCPERVGYSLEGILRGEFDASEDWSKTRLMEEWLFVLAYSRRCSKFRAWKSVLTI